MDLYKEKYEAVMLDIDTALLGTRDENTKIVLEDIKQRNSESEDERIINRIINLLHTGGYLEEPDRTTAFAWLEKQKEHSMSAEEVLTRAGLKPYKDGNQWCILVGDNIQEGICGFGDTIDEALYEFLKEILIMANSPQLKEQKPVMIQWTGKNLKEVIDFTGKSPKFGEWFKSWEDFENYVHSHYDILKLFCEDGSHYEVPVGAWIVKTPDGYNTPSVFRFIQKPVAQEGTAVRGPEPYGPIHFDQS